MLDARAFGGGWWLGIVSRPTEFYRLVLTVIIAGTSVTANCGLGFALEKYALCLIGCRKPLTKRIA